MRQELDDLQLDEVTGGTVSLSEHMGLARFSSVGKTYKLNPDIPFKEIRNCLLDLYDENSGMSDKDFDKLVAKAFRAKGYI